MQPVSTGPFRLRSRLNEFYKSDAIFLSILLVFVVPVLLILKQLPVMFEVSERNIRKLQFSYNFFVVSFGSRDIQDVSKVGIKQ